MLKPVSAALFAASLIAPPAWAAAPPPLLVQALNRPVADMATTYRYTRTTVVRAMGQPPEVEVERYDPARPDGKKWEKLSSTMDDTKTGTSGKPSFSMHRKGSTNDESLMGYAELQQLVRDADVSLLSETADRAVFRITSKPGHALKMGGIDIQTDATRDGMTGVLYVQKSGRAAPYVSGVKLGLAKPVNTMIVDIPRLAFGYGYAPDEKTGDMVLKAFGFDMQMKMPIAPKIKVSVMLTNAGFEKVAGK